MGAPSGFEQFYVYRAPSYVPAGSRPALPIPPETIRARPEFAEATLDRLPEAEALVAALLRNGFAVLDEVPPGPGTDDIGMAYWFVTTRHLPVYVTVDSMLHLYHLVFDGLLSALETEQLAPLLGRLLAALRDRAAQDAAQGDVVGRAAARNLAFLETALRLVDPSAALAPASREAVEKDLAAIERHAGSTRSAVFGYEEDWTQYAPRGHYTRSAALARYFRAMMWLGRMGFLARADDDPEPRGIVPREDARLFAAQSALFSAWLREVQVDGTAAVHAWSRVYRTTAFFAGFADDVTPTEVSAAAERVFGEIWTPSQLEDQAKLDELRLHIAAIRLPRLYVGKEGAPPPVVPPGASPPAALEAMLAATAGMRFLGQRYAPDAEAMMRLTWPLVGRHAGQGTPFTLVRTSDGPVRGFARGLDVMALLGAPRARPILDEAGDTAYERFDEAFAEASAAFPPAGDARWHANVYWAWLEALRETVAPAAPPNQAFQTTGAWTDRLTAGALASWAALRRDTILYVKQPSTAKAAGERPTPPPGFVDPYPEAFARLQALGRMTRVALRDMRLLPDESPATEVLVEFESLLEGLAAVATAEVEDRAPDAAATALLEGFALRCRDLLGRIAGMSLGPAGEAAPAADLRTTLVADVMTNGEAQEVLEEGSGRLGLLIAVVRTPGGSDLFLAAGPVLTYYEFRSPIGGRLTDERWREMLASGAPPQRPSWTCSFRVGCGP
jgi:hypothetical protein